MGAVVAASAPLVKRGRPAGEVYLKLLQVSHAIKRERAESGQGATLKELAMRGCVGLKAARYMVAALKRRGQLDIVGWRCVTYRNRPVAEYAPAKLSDIFEASSRSVLDQCIAGWTR